MLILCIFMYFVRNDELNMYNQSFINSQTDFPLGFV